MFKLMGKKIITILNLKVLLIWPYVILEEVHLRFWKENDGEANSVDPGLKNLSVLCWFMPVCQSI